MQFFFKTCFVQQQIRINAVLKSEFCISFLLFFIFMRRFTFTANVLHIVVAAAFEIQFCAAAADSVAANRKAQPRNSYEANNAGRTAAAAATIKITITKAQSTTTTTT